MIPTNRRVRGDDVVQVERRLGLRPADMQWLLGANTHVYYTLRNSSDTTTPASAKTRKNGLTQALTIRFLSAGDPPLPLVLPPRVGEIYSLCQEIDPDFTPRHLGVLLGRDGASGYRWIHMDSGTVMRQEVVRWMTIVWLALTAETSHRARKNKLTELFDLVLLEASLRGYDPVALREKFKFVPIGRATKPRSAKGAADARVAPAEAPAGGKRRRKA